MPETDRKQQYDRVTMDLELMDFKMYTIRDIIMVKRGQLSFPFPQGVDPLTAQADESEDFEEIKNNSKQENGVKKFIKSIFRRKKDK